MRVPAVERCANQVDVEGRKTAGVGPLIDADAGDNSGVKLKNMTPQKTKASKITEIFNLITLKNCVFILLLYEERRDAPYRRLGEVKSRRSLLTRYCLA